MIDLDLAFSFSLKTIAIFPIITMSTILLFAILIISPGAAVHRVLHHSTIQEQ